MFSCLHKVTIALGGLHPPTVVEHSSASGDEPTCCLAHGSAGAFICAVHAMLYLMGKVVAATTSAVTSCRCAECCC